MPDQPSIIDLIRTAAEQADSSQAVIATDVEGQIVFWNERAEALYGYRASETIGRTSSTSHPRR